jgi:hypothetical protein
MQERACADGPRFPIPALAGPPEVTRSEFSHFLGNSDARLAQERDSIENLADRTGRARQASEPRVWRTKILDS